MNGTHFENTMTIDPPSNDTKIPPNQQSVTRNGPMATIVPLIPVMPPFSQQTINDNLNNDSNNNNNYNDNNNNNNVTINENQWQAGESQSQQTNEKSQLSINNDTLTQQKKQTNYEKSQNIGTMEENNKLIVGNKDNNNNNNESDNEENENMNENNNNNNNGNNNGKMDVWLNDDSDSHPFTQQKMIENMEKQKILTIKHLIIFVLALILLFLFFAIFAYYFGNIIAQATVPDNTDFTNANTINAAPKNKYNTHAN